VGHPLVQFAHEGDFPQGGKRAGRGVVALKVVKVTLTKTSRAHQLLTMSVPKVVRFHKILNYANLMMWLTLICHTKHKWSFSPTQVAIEFTFHIFISTNTFILNDKNFEDMMNNTQHSIWFGSRHVHHQPTTLTILQSRGDNQMIIIRYLVLLIEILTYVNQSHCCYITNTLTNTLMATLCKMFV
jgi:hypothetical protein